MPAELMNASAVVVAHDVNLSIFRPPWLRDQKILSDDELAGDIVITPPLVRIPTSSFELLILPDRVQLRLTNDARRAQGDVLRVLGGIVSTLPHTPFTGIGLNFDYIVSPGEDADFTAWNKARFAAPFSISAIGEIPEDARFGVYYSFDIFGMRLNADLKPVRGRQEDEQGALRLTDGREAMQAKFNFHQDLSRPPAVSEILKVLGRWNEVAAFASHLASEASAIDAERE